MKVGILSDTHSNAQRIERAFNIFSQIETKVIIHAGDWADAASLNLCCDYAHQLNCTLFGVYGNNDKAEELLSESVILKSIVEVTINGCRIGVCHGHNKADLATLLASQNTVIVRGHSHKPKIETYKDKMIINPGSTVFDIPRSQKFIPTVAAYDTEKNYAQIYTI